VNVPINETSKLAGNLLREMFDDSLICERGGVQSELASPDADVAAGDTFDVVVSVIRTNA
jgi:hypothetical protein